MAKRADQFQEDPPKLNHNAKARKDIIRKVAQELDRIDGEIKTLREEAATIRNERVKGELGMKVSDFNLARRLYALEDDDRAKALDTFREAYEALCKGDQLDWLDATGQAPRPQGNGAATEGAQAA